MADNGTVVIIGGTSALGEGVAQHYSDKGYKIVVTSRDLGRAQAAAKEIGENATGLAFDLSQPLSIAQALSDVDDVVHLVLVSVARDENTVKDYNVEAAIELVTLKLVGYTEVIHVMAPRMREGGSILLFGGLAKERPYPGSTTITTINGGVMTLVRTLAIELAPLRVNAIHPAVVGDSPYWADKPAAVIDRIRDRTPLGTLITINDVVDASVFLLENPAVTGINLDVDGGWLLT